MSVKSLAVDLSTKWSATGCFTKPSFLLSLLQSYHLRNQRHVQPLLTDLALHGLCWWLAVPRPFSFLFVYVTVRDSLPAMATVPLLPVMPLTGISSHPRFPAGSVKQLISSQVISQPLLLVSWRWYSRNHYLELKTFLYPCPHLPQQEELSNPIFSAMEKLFHNKAGRRHFFSR